MSSTDAGKFYGIGVGPGDPELMTIKAVRAIEACPVLAVPRTRGEHTLALDIAARAVNISGKEILYLDFPMTGDAGAMEENHAGHAARIAEQLDAGRDVGMLSLGDASIYSTFSYVAERVAAMGYAVETIPGVASFSACAAALNMSLTKMRLPLYVFPASYEGLEEALALPGGKVVMKPARSLEEIKCILAKKGLLDKASAVSDCGLPSQRVYERVEEISDESYFTTILIHP